MKAKTHEELGRVLIPLSIVVQVRGDQVGLIPRPVVIHWDCYGKDRQEAITRMTEAIISHLKTRED